MAGLGIGMAGAMLTISLLIVGRGWIVDGYTSDASVAVGAMALIRLLVVFHMLDALQCITSYILRAHKIAVAPMLIQAVTLWGLGLGGGWWLGFGSAVNPLEGMIKQWLPGAPVGAATLWLMAILAMVLTTVSLQYWYHRVRQKTTDEAAAV